MGASYELTQFRSDFIDYVECDILVKDETRVNRVIGIGTTIHKFIESNGKDILLPCISYNLTQTYERIFSTQTYHQMNGGQSIVNRNKVTTHLKFHGIHIPLDLGRTILPVVTN